MNLQRPIIAIRCGHGQNSKGEGDPGACAGELKEDNITLAVGTALKFALASEFNVIMPRSNDEWVDKKPEDRLFGLKKAVQEANSAGADVFISIHVNAAASEKAEGTEALYFNPASKMLAQKLTDACCKVLDTRNRGIKENNDLYEDRHSKAKLGCLLELAFLSNPGDRKKLKLLMENREYRLSLANALATSIKSVVK